MKHWTGISPIAALLLASSVFAQTEDWRSAMQHANELKRAGRYAEAVAPYEEAVRIAERSGASLQLAAARNGLGLVYDCLDRLSEAERQYHRALEALDKITALASVARAQILVNLSGIHLHRGQLAKSEQMLRAGIAIYSELLPPDAVLLAAARNGLAQTLLARGEYLEPEQLINLALPVFEKQSEHLDGDTSGALNNLGTVRRYQGRNEDAVVLFLRAIAVGETESGMENPSLIYPLDNLGITYIQLNRYQEAEPLLGRAAAIAGKSFGTANPVYGKVLMDYASCIRKAGKKKEARTLETRANEALRNSSLSSGVDATVDVSAFRPSSNRR